MDVFELVPLFLLSTMAVLGDVSLFPLCVMPPGSPLIFREWEFGIEVSFFLYYLNHLVAELSIKTEVAFASHFSFASSLMILIHENSYKTAGHSMCSVSVKC